MSRVSALRNAAFTMSGQLLARLLALVLYAALARAVGPERYGDFAFGTALGTLGVALLEPGLIPLLVRDGARSSEKLRERLAEAFGYKLVALLLVWPAIVGIAAVMGYRGHALAAVLLAGGAILLGAFEDLAAGALTAVERLDLEGSLRFASKVLSASLGLLAIFLAGSFETILSAMLVATLSTAAVGALLVRKAGIKVTLAFRPRVLATQLAEMWPLTASGIMWLLVLRLDQVIASAMGVGHAALGNYGAAAKIVEALVLFPGAIATTFQPRLARAWAVSPDACSSQLRTALLASLSLAVPVAVGGSVLANGLATFVYGARFDGAAPLLAIQLLCLPVIGFQFLSTHALVAAGAIRVQAIAVGTNLVVNVVTNLLLVPRFGVMGASFSALAGGVAASGVYAWAMRAQGLRTGLLSAAWRPLLAAAAMALALWSLRGQALPLFAAIGVGAVVYAAVFLAVGGLQALRSLMAAREPAPAPADLEVGRR